MSIEICIFCHNFQKRLCWMLSSIAQQSGKVPSIRVNVASLKYNGKPTTEEVLEEFKQYFSVKHVQYEDREEIAYRGIVRNRQIKESLGDWLFFADSDYVYHPQFFESLANKLEPNDTGYYYCTKKVSTSVKSTNDAVRFENRIYIPDAYKRAQKIKTIHYKYGACSAGNMQVISRETLKKYGDTYARPLEPNRRYLHQDFHLFNQMQCARSDLAFRNKLDGCTKIDLPLQIHLNHIRDKDLGRHTEMQR